MNDYEAVDTRHEAMATLSFDSQMGIAHRSQTLATIYVGDQLARIANALERAYPEPPSTDLEF